MAAALVLAGLPAVAAGGSEAWVARGTAVVAALDKMRAEPTTLTIPVGQSAQFRTLTIAVRSCMVRPPDQPGDATAFLDVTDSQPSDPSFHGWMLAGEPGLSMLQSPLYDLRLLACR